MEGKEESEKEIKILLVEDLEPHVLLIKNALEESKMRERVFVARDGEEALDFLFNRGDYASVDEYPKPDVILLDLGLPKIDGIEVLERVKSEEKLKDIPVVVLTASESGEDIIKTYEGGVKSYILKSTFFAKKKGKMEGLLDTIFSLIR